MSNRQIKQSIRRRILLRDQYRCVLCGDVREDGIMPIDHIVPRCFGGTDDDDNLRVLCWSCNQAKGVEEWKEWRKRQLAAKECTL